MTGSLITGHFSLIKNGPNVLIGIDFSWMASPSKKFTINSIIINNDITQIYTKQSSEYYNELTSSGFKKYTKDEFNSLRDTFCAQKQLGRISKLENDIDLEF